MNTLALFNEKRMAEFSPEASLSELKAAGWSLESFDIFNNSNSLAEQLGINAPKRIKDNLVILHAQGDSQFFSTINVNPLRIGNNSGDHIRLLNAYGDSLGSVNANVISQSTLPSLAIYKDHLVLIEGCIYLNGIKYEAKSQSEHAVSENINKYQISVGDTIWVNTAKIILHKDYIECAGMGFATNLNISTVTPEVYTDFPEYKRSPRIIKRPLTDEVQLKAPPKKEDKKKWEILKVILPPVMMSGVMVGGSLLMGRGLFVLISAAAMFASVTFSVIMLFSDRKEKRKKQAEREDDYDKYLLSKRKDIHKLFDAERDSLLYHNLSIKEIEQEVLSHSSRIYERASGDSDFLTLSLGYGTIPAKFSVKYEEDSENKDPLMKEMKELGDLYKTIPDMPIVIDLKEAHLGLVGDKPYIHRQLSSILAQISFYQSYHDVEVIFLHDEEYKQNFEWARWYPHCRINAINITGIISTENHRDQALGNIAQMLKMRKQKQEEEKKDSRYLPHYVFIIDNPKLIINHSIMEYLQSHSTSLGFSLIYTTHIQANLPENIKTVFLLTGGDHGTLVMNEGHLLNQPVVLPSLEGVDLETMARKIAPLRHSQGVSTQIPESVTFFELYNIKRPDEIPVLDLWNKNACHKSLAVPLGLRGKDDVVSLNLHEKAHGSHGLVAGTTGSGKSEIVQSYILSLAVNFHPYEVGFLLIDYKGGGMANLFSKLPHLLGTITNLDGSESMRALASIKSELARRQRIFNEHNVNSINQYTKLFRAADAAKEGDDPPTTPLPHLFIISDEFAELKKEQPDFMTELVSVARIGRSLGVHLILATQKPTGVVDDQIWSNSKFKLALKLADESDSNEVIKTPDAARITQPGRAYLQVGNNEIYELFQSAYSGATYSEDVIERGFDGRVYMMNRLGQGDLLNEDLSLLDSSGASNLTQLDVTVNYVNSLYKMLGAAPVEKPWLPPLSSKIVSDELLLRLEKESDTISNSNELDVGKIANITLELALGMVDIPEQQQQIEYRHNFAEDGNLAVFGASGFGKSTAIMNIALSLASNNSPKLLNYFIMDYGNSALVQLRGLPHTADYLSIDDTEKLEKLEKHLAEELKKRKQLFASVNAINFKMYNDVATEKLPAIIIFIDNFDMVREVNQELEENLVKLSRDGVGVGVYMAITASRPSAVRYSVLNNFKNKLAMFMYDASDAASIMGRSAYQIPEVKGRALVKMKDVHIAQLYLPVSYEDEVSYVRLIGEAIDNISHFNTAPKAIGIRILPEIVQFEDIAPYVPSLQISKEQPNPKKAIVGFNVETTEPEYLDLSITSHLIVGGPSSGKTNVLKILLNQLQGTNADLAQSNPVFIADSRAGDLHQYDGLENITYMDSDSQLNDFYDKLLQEVENRQRQFEQSGLRPRDFSATIATAFIIIDDGDNFVELCRAKEMEMQAILTKSRDVGFVIITTTIPSKLRGYDGITSLLKDNQSGVVLGNPNDQGIFQVVLPRGFKLANDIGFLCKRGDVKAVKMPEVE